MSGEIRIYSKLAAIPFDVTYDSNMIEITPEDKQRREKTKKNREKYEKKKK